MAARSLIAQDSHTPTPKGWCAVNVRRSLLLVVVFLLALGSRAHAQQQADIIRGKVIGPDSQPIANVNVLVTSFMGGINKSTKTNKSGQFSVVFPNGEGDYWVAFASVGYTFKRFELKRIADEEVLTANTKLDKAKVTQQLDTVAVTTSAARGTPPRSSVGDATSNEKYTSSGAVTAAQAGNIAAMVGGLPGFQFIPGVDGNPDAFSVLGLGPDQNNTTLNGANGSTGDVPRDASIGVSASTSTWDVSRGGFSGAQVSLTTRSGTNYLSRSLSTQFDTPSLQWTDNVGGSTGAQYTRMSFGSGLSGPVTMDRNFYSGGIQFDRTYRDLQTLFNTNQQGLQTAGVSADSVARLRGILGNLGIPAALGINNPTTDQFRQNAAFDFAPKSATSGSAYQLSENINYTKSAPTNTSLMAAPSYSGDNRNFSGILVGRHTNYVWSSVLTQTWLTASLSSQKTDPNLAFPAANVRVSSDLDDGSATVRTLQFGGNSGLGSNRTTGSLSARNQLNWYAGNNKHALKLTTELRDDWFNSKDPTNQ
ncbi:MAG TPA: carboxypeptidase regulatory-like domain-containing protein, partial [Gemmatimonadaceae bacterium]|nr:carboxypeptidase regulatory-like domain-containing protein [Gemmatimonadaceae bacterium]